MDKERQIRARVEGIYCKERGDFDSLEAWNDYLEEKEDVKDVYARMRAKNA